MKRALSTALVLSLGSALTQQAVAQASNPAALDFGPRAPASVDFNSIAIDSTASPYDQALLAEVRAAIASDPTLQGVALSVSVSEGRVNITGTVLDEAQARQAATVAMRIAGATRVSSAIATTR